MNNKAFTLVELLAVIIILCALSVLIIPKTTNMLKKAEESTYITSVEGIISSATYKYSNNEAAGIINEDILIDYGKGINKKYLDYNGQMPEIGQVKITKEGKIALAVKFENNCFKKEYDYDKINIEEYNENTCLIEP